MPQAFAGWVANFFIGTTIAASTAYAVAYVVASVVITAGLNSLTSRKRPTGTTASPIPEGARDVTARGTTQYRQIIYGEVRTGGTLAWLGCSGTNNQYLWFAVVVAAHECDAITDVWLDNQIVRNGEASPFSGKLTIWKYLGGNSQLVDPNLDSAFTEWTNSFIGTGIAYVVYRLERDPNVWYNGAPSEFFQLVRGRKLYDPRLDSTNGGSGTQRHTDASTWTWSNNAILAMRDYVSGGSIVYYSTPRKEYGANELDSRIDDAYTIAAANEADEHVRIPIPFASFTNTANFTHSAGDFYKTGGGSGWGEGSYSTDGVTSGWIMAAYYGGSGRQIIGFHTSAALAGSGGVGLQCAYGWYLYGDNTQIQIVEAGTAVTTISRAPVVGDIVSLYYDGHSIYYYLNDVLQRRTAVSTEGQTLYLNVSSYAVNQGFKAGIQRRYTCDIQLSCGDTHSVNLSKLRSATAGNLAHVSGKYRLFAGAYDTPTVDINEDDIFGPVEVVTAPPLSEIYNRVSGTFYDRDRNWSEITFPARTNSTYESEDGEARERQIELPGTLTSWRAQRIGELILKQSRLKTTIRLTKLGPKAMQIGEWSTFNLYIPEYGWEPIVCRCLEWEFDTATGFIAILARLETSATYTDPTVAQYLTAQTAGYAPVQVDGISEPTGFTYQGAPNGIEFKWNNPTFTNFVIELWEGSSGSNFSSATKIWEGKANGKFITKADSTLRSYWIRARTADLQYAGPVPGASSGLSAVASVVSASLSATVSPSSFGITTANTSYTTTSAAVTAAGGATPYTYAWSWHSGGTNLTITSTTASSTTFSTSTSLSVGETRTGVAKCIVTDNLGATYTVYVNISITRPAMSAVMSPSSITVSDTTASITTGSATAVPSNGATPYTYAWSWQSGGTGITINSTTSQATTFTAATLGSPETRTGTAQCVVSDNAGQSVTITVSVSISRIADTDTFSMYAGQIEVFYTVDEYSFHDYYQRGFADGSYGGSSFGSFTPGQVSDGYPIRWLFERDTPVSGGSALLWLRIDNFTGDPGQNYFSKMAIDGVDYTSASATYSYSSGVADWVWYVNHGILEGETYGVVITY